VLRLRSRDQVVVDGILIGAGRIDMDESLLTGESDLVSKSSGDRLYSGSFCVNGTALYKATHVGTESVANQLTAGARAFRRVHTPLQREINHAVQLIGIDELELRALLGDCAASTQAGNRTSAAIRAQCIGQSRRVIAEVPFSSERKWSALVLDNSDTCWERRRCSRPTRNTSQALPRWLTDGPRVVLFTEASQSRNRDARW
jgi:magnesium-transporting ATPase (P-type)